MTSPAVHAGWYPAPNGSAETWWWDGRGWLQPHRDPRTEKTIARLAVATQALLIASGALSLATAVHEIFGILAGTSYLDGRSEALSMIDTYDSVSIVVAVLYTVLLVATGVVWAIWQYRVAQQVVGRTRRSPGWHAWSWFIPVVSLWFPLQNVSDLWRTTGRRLPEWVPVWWMLWVLSSVAVSISNQANARAGTIDAFLVGMWASLVGALLLLAAALPAWRLIREITRAVVAPASAPPVEDPAAPNF